MFRRLVAVSMAASLAVSTVVVSQAGAATAPAPIQPAVVAVAEIPLAPAAAERLQLLPAAGAIIAAAAVVVRGCAVGGAVGAVQGTVQRLVGSGRVADARALVSDVLWGCVWGIPGASLCRRFSPCKSAVQAGTRAIVDTWTEQVIRRFR